MQQMETGDNVIKSMNEKYHAFSESEAGNYKSRVEEMTAVIQRN